VAGKHIGTSADWEIPGSQTACGIPRDAGLYAETTEHSEDIYSDAPGKPPLAAQRPVSAGQPVALRGRHGQIRYFPAVSRLNGRLNGKHLFSVISNIGSNCLPRFCMLSLNHSQQSREFVVGWEPILFAIDFSGRPARKISKNLVTADAFSFKSLQCFCHCVAIVKYQ
jgi:hypothetical protein